MSAADFSSSTPSFGRPAGPCARLLAWVKSFSYCQDGRTFWGPDVTDLSFLSRWEFRGVTRSADRLAEFRSFFGNKRMIFVVVDDGSIKFYTERQGQEASLVPSGYREVYVS